MIGSGGGWLVAPVTAGPRSWLSRPLGAGFPEAALVGVTFCAAAGAAAPIKDAATNRARPAPGRFFANGCFIRKVRSLCNEKFRHAFGPFIVVSAKAGIVFPRRRYFNPDNAPA